MSTSFKARVQLKDLVASQLPEFVRSQYPTFVAFVEAYYEYLDKNSVDLEKLRDIDDTLDDFIKYFKAELAHNYPITSDTQTERYLLKHVRDQYLAKGSEASYKLLFRLLFGKEVYMDYPGKQMLRVSDGRWQQDMSLFVRVDQGNPYDIIGKIVDVQTSRKIYRTTPIEGYDYTGVNVTKITANIENVVKFSGNVYEIFLNKNFYGEIISGDVIKYGSSFQGQVLPVTSKLKIQNKGVGFKPGMVFQVSSGDGTPLWFKVLTTENYIGADGKKYEGGLKNVDLIKFGIGYNTDFSINVLPSSAVSSNKKITVAPVTLKYNITPKIIVSVRVINGGSGYTSTPDVAIGGSGSGATAHAIVENGQVTQIIVDTAGQGYELASVVITGGGATENATAEPLVGTIYQYSYTDKTEGFTENGYLGDGDYWDLEQHGTGATAQLLFKPTDATFKYKGSGYQVGDTFKISFNVLNESNQSVSKEVFYTVSSVDNTGGITGVTPSSNNYEHTKLPTYNSNGYSITGISVHGTNAKAIPLFRVSDISITNGGSGYFLDSPYIDIDPPVDSFGVPTYTGIKAKAKLSYSNGVVTDATLASYIKGVSVTSGGSGYTREPNLYVNSTEGSGAKLRAILTNGVVSGVSIVNGGNGYYVNPTITVGDSWTLNGIISQGDQIFYADRLYTALTNGSLGATPPTHTTTTVSGGFFVVGRDYTIATLGTTDWNAVAGTSGVTYEIGNTITATATGSGNGTATTRTATNGSVELRYAGTPATLEVTQMTQGGYGYTTVPPAKIWGAGGYSDGAYVGNVRRQYFIDAKNTLADNSALLNVYLGALAKYPGYYKTNDGFLDDSMFIQDSYYYQAFAYVLKIDEQLQSYASVVRTMLHPSGMAMFGEYSINNKIDLSVGLKSLVKSLGISIKDIAIVSDSYEVDDNGHVIRGSYFSVYKYLETNTVGTFTESVRFWDKDDPTAGFRKRVQDDSVLMTEIFTKVFSKTIGFVGQTETVFAIEDGSKKYFSKSVVESYGPYDSVGGYGIRDVYTRLATSKTFGDFQPIAETASLAVTLNRIDDPLPGVYPESGYVVLNAYEEGGFFLEHYANNRDATFSS
jgi:hypothetical protein